ncbi:MAG: MtnX-like HAD-IB family phosphatase [Tepidiformaceae bacterium]
MANILCLDFDDTIVMENTARQIFERFAAPEWRDHEGKYQAGRISVEQFNAAALDLVQAEPDELAEFVLSVARPREGFLELLDWAQWNDWLPMVVSNGFDIYINPVLDGLGIDRVTRHAGRARFDYRWRVTYFSPRGVEIQDGFKLAYASSLKNAGDSVIYIGDGESDVAAATLAERVFARSTLLERLEGSHPNVAPFQTFHDVVAALNGA